MCRLFLHFAMEELEQQLAALQVADVLRHSKQMPMPKAGLVLDFAKLCCETMGELMLAARRSGLGASLLSLEHPHLQLQNFGSSWWKMQDRGPKEPAGSICCGVFIWPRFAQVNQRLHASTGTSICSADHHGLAWIAADSCRLPQTRRSPQTHRLPQTQADHRRRKQIAADLNRLPQT
jgi:hypothetical protein